MLIIVYNVTYESSYAITVDSPYSGYVQDIIDKAFKSDETVLSEEDVLKQLGESKGLTMYDPVEAPPLPIEEVFSIIEHESLPVDALSLAGYYDHSTGGLIPNNELTEIQTDAGVEAYLATLEMGVGDEYDTAIQKELPTDIAEILSPEKLVQIRLTQLERRFEFIMNWITHKYTRDEIASWGEQRRNVECWEKLAANDKTVANAPAGLKALAIEAHGVAEVDLDPVLHIQERANDVTVNADFYEPYSLGAVGKKKKKRKKLKELPTDTTGKTPAEKQAMRDAILAEESNDFLTFGVQKFIDAGLL